MVLHTRDEAQNVLEAINNLSLNCKLGSINVANYEPIFYLLNSALKYILRAGLTKAELAISCVSITVKVGTITQYVNLMHRPRKRPTHILLSIHTAVDYM